MKKIILTGLVVLLAFCGCDNESTTNLEANSSNILQSSLSRDESPTYSDASLETLVANNNKFAFNLFQTFDLAKGENIFTSPISVTTALAMLYPAANGETKNQMAQALEFTQSDTELFPTFNALDMQLNFERNESNIFKEDNAIWPQDGYAIKESYLDTIMQNFGASIYTQDFIANTELARNNINTHISEHTNHKIKELLLPGTLDASTRVVLTNTVYFKSNWKKQFNEELTQEREFYLLDGSSEALPMMAQTETYMFMQDANVSAIELPYINEENSMIIILPKSENWYAYINSFGLDSYNAILKNMQNVNVALKLPKFSLTLPRYLLKSNLQQLGMEQAFTPLADFSKMVENEALYVDDVIHQTYIGVNEQGTEAAAATAVLLVTTSLPETQPKVMNIDHPFICIIRNNKTNQILFLGTITNPKR